MPQEAQGLIWAYVQRARDAHPGVRDGHHIMFSFTYTSVVQDIKASLLINRLFLCWTIQNNHIAFAIEALVGPGNNAACGYDILLSSDNPIFQFYIDKFVNWPRTDIAETNLGSCRISVDDPLAQAGARLSEEVGAKVGLTDLIMADDCSLVAQFSW
jgi:hypothetical protein